MANKPFDTGTDSIFSNPPSMAVQKKPVPLKSNPSTMNSSLLSVNTSAKNLTPPTITPTVSPADQKLMADNATVDTALPKAPAPVAPATPLASNPPEEKKPADTPTPTPTLQSAAAGITMPTAPTPLTALPTADQTGLNTVYDAKAAQINADYQGQLEELNKQGEANMATAKGLLAKIGALGTTISGMPLESGLGAISAINDQTKAMGDKIKQARDLALQGNDAAAVTAANDKLKILNDAQQASYDNAIKLVQTQISAGNNRYTTVGSNIFDTTTGTFIMGEAVGTTDTKNYEYYVKQEKAAGRDALNFDEWFTNQKAPAAVKEYLAAKQNGFTGSIIEYQQQKKGSTNATLDADTVQFLADKFLVDGQVPAFGMGTAGATTRVQFWNAVAQDAAAKGMTGAAASANKASYDAAKTSLAAMTKQVSFVTSSEKTAIQNLDYAYTLGQEYERSGTMPKANQFLNWLSGNVGNTQLSAFEVALYTGAREYAKVASGAAGSVSGLTDSATKEAEKLVNAAMTQGQLKSTLDTMKVDMKNVEGNQNAVIQGLKDQISNTLGGSTPETPTDQSQGDNTLEGYYKNHPDEQANIEKMITENPNISDDDILKILGIPGFSSVGNTSDSTTAMRTDRHNNPTAFTTDVAKTAGLVEGKDYVAGDPFNGGVTARLLGDPIDTTIKVIDKIGFETASGKPRWTYIDMPKDQWTKLSYNQKKQVISMMYKNEGGSELNNLFA